MKDEDGVQKSVAEHVLWCRRERDRLAHELDQFQKGFLSVGERKIGAPVTQGTLTHVAFLQRNIGQLDRVIAAYSPPRD